MKFYIDKAIAWGSNLQLVKDTFRQKSFKIAFFIRTKTKYACFDKKLLLSFGFDEKTWFLLCDVTK